MQNRWKECILNRCLIFSCQLESNATQFCVNRKLSILQALTIMYTKENPRRNCSQTISSKSTLNEIRKIIQLCCMIIPIEMFVFILYFVVNQTASDRRQTKLKKIFSGNYCCLLHELARNWQMDGWWIWELIRIKPASLASQIEPDFLVSFIC